MLTGRGLCDELITRPEESYRQCCVVVCDLETSRMGAPYIYIYIYIYIYDISRLRVKQEYIMKLVNWIQEANEYYSLSLSVLLQQTVINTPNKVIVQEERKVRNGWFCGQCTENTKIKTRLVL